MKKLFLSCLISSFALANSMYLNKDVEIKLDGKIIGTASLLAPVKVISSNNDTSKVELIGYVNDNYQEEIVKSFSQIENYMSFHDNNDNPTYKGDANPYIKMLEVLQDEYGENWHKVSITFDVNSNDLVASKDKIFKNAKSFYEQTCSPCHLLHDTKEYSVNQWPSNLESMISSGYVELSKDEKSLIIKYLQNHAKDIK
ncbi:MULTISPECIES: hypothetical protein [unclassified Campylobacter]|uniref:hypothetical protein n=1 Tax=unclassified Campylobacter TaxID=2593542 RepID=UPI001D3D24D3|nr:hypothetical protein [Campylobacter sp. RM9331]MBZ8005994.1 hypothetical protein [Campylobacter sp. RM9332]